MTTRSAVLGLLVLAAAGVLLWVRSRTDVQLTPAEAGAEAHRDIAYGDHERNRLDVYVPPGEGPFPTIIWFHSGGWISGDKSASMPVWDWTERGYAIVSVNYRYAIAPDTLSGAVDDARRAVEHVLAHHDEWNLDSDRIGVYGHSAGGHLAAMVAHYRLDVAAVAISGAPTDLGPLLDPTVPFFDGERGPGVVEAVRSRLGCGSDPIACEASATAVSPAQLDPGTVDLLIVHGDADHIVDVGQAIRLHEHLTGAGGQVELVIVQGGAHGINVEEGGIDRFFDERLLR